MDVDFEYPFNFVGCRVVAQGRAVQTITFNASQNNLICLGFNLYLGCLCAGESLGNNISLAVSSDIHRRVLYRFGSFGLYPN